MSAIPDEAKVPKTEKPKPKLEQEVPTILRYMGYLADLSQELRRSDESILIEVTVQGEGSLMLQTFPSVKQNAAVSSKPVENVVSKKPSRDEIDRKLQAQGFDSDILTDKYDADTVTLKMKKQVDIDTWKAYNTLLKELGFAWVKYDATDKANTGLWRWVP